MSSDIDRQKMSLLYEINMDQRKQLMDARIKKGSALTPEETAAILKAAATARPQPIAETKQCWMSIGFCFGLVNQWIHGKVDWATMQYISNPSLKYRFDVSGQLSTQIYEQAAEEALRVAVLSMNEQLILHKYKIVKEDVYYMNVQYDDLYATPSVVDDIISKMPNGYNIPTLPINHSHNRTHFYNVRGAFNFTTVYRKNITKGEYEVSDQKGVICFYNATAYKTHPDDEVTNMNHMIDRCFEYAFDQKLNEVTARLSAGSIPYCSRAVLNNSWDPSGLFKIIPYKEVVTPFLNI